jgi:hypothetical protein
MSKDNVFALKKPESIIVDQITDCRRGAGKLLAQALEGESEKMLTCCHLHNRHYFLFTEFQNSL